MSTTTATITTVVKEKKKNNCQAKPHELTLKDRNELLKYNGEHSIIGHYQYYVIISIIPFCYFL